MPTPMLVKSHNTQLHYDGYLKNLRFHKPKHQQLAEALAPGNIGEWRRVNRLQAGIVKTCITRAKWGLHNG